MRLLYISVHQVLEYDELRMFRDAGHEMFSLGTYFEAKPSRDIRPALDLGPGWAELRGAFEALGGRYDENTAACIIPAAFVDLFDACIVMHDVDIFRHHWETLSRIPVIWRTIGVDIFTADPPMKPYRERGCFVVRYSPLETGVPGHVGTDAVIRFPKVLSDFDPWEGDTPAILKFYTNFRQRFPAEHDFVERLSMGRHFMLGGAGNEDCRNWIGFASPDRQMELLGTSRVYFYGAGPPCPYTLNFMEAWLAGIPVVVLDPGVIYSAHDSRFMEIPSLITHGDDGFIVGSVAEAGAVCDRLLRDHSLAWHVGRNGARKAAGLFEAGAVAAAWDAVLGRVVRGR